MLPADPSKVSPDFLIRPAAKSAALDLIDRLEESQICSTSGSKTPQCIHTRPQFGKLPIDQNSFYRLKADHPGTEKTMKKKRNGYMNSLSLLFCMREISRLLQLCEGRIEKISTELLKWDQTPPGILLRQCNIKWVSWKKCFPTSASADTRKLNINAFKRASAGTSNCLSLCGGVETWAIQCVGKRNDSAWFPVAGMQCNPGNSRCAVNSPC